MQMYIHDIESFLAIAQTRNISRAAESLYMSQTAITHRLKSLEQELGVTLFERGRGIKEVAITPSGLEFMPIAKRWKSLWQEIEHFKETGENLSLSFGSVQYLNDFIFLPLFQTLFSHRPKIHLEIHTEHTTELYPLVEQRLVDVAVVWRDIKYPNVICTPWQTVPMVLLKSGSPQTAGKMTIKNARLDTGKELYIPWTPDFKIWHDEHWPTDYYDLPILLTGSPLTLKLLKDNDYWAIVPLWMAKYAVSLGEYTYMELEDPPKNLTAYTIRHKNPRPSTEKSLHIFYSYLKELKV